MGKASFSQDILTWSDETIRHSLFWRPLSLQPLVLSSVIGFTVLTVITLGILQWKSNRDNGILFSEIPGELPAGLTFLYLYFPDILAVFYSTLWNWIDLDVKRLEPWYQLSRPSGAAAKDSILLKYPLEFMTVVPLRSAKRKQWGVFCTSTILVAVFWIVTPLQSGIFAVQKIYQSKPLSLVTSNQFLPIEEQIDQLNLDFVNDGYGITWLDQPLPPFTTRTYTLAPFKPEHSEAFGGTNNTLTATTTLFGADLDCELPASAVEQANGGFTFKDGRSCVVEDVFLESLGQGFQATYDGFYSRRILSSSVNKRDWCGKGIYFANWARRGEYKDQPPSTTLFCYTHYYKQQVQATVSLPGYSVKSVNSIGPKLPVSNQSFAISHFEKIIETHVLIEPQQNITSIQQDYVGRTDIDEVSPIEQMSLLNDRNIFLSETSELIGFAVGLGGVEPVDLLKPTNLHNAFRAAHQLLFALGAAAVFEEPSLTDSSMAGVATSSLEAVHMVEAFTYTVICFLSLIALTTTYILYTYVRRPLNLRSGPNSLAHNMALAYRQTDLLEVFRSLHSAKVETIAKKLKGSFFKLEKQEDECRLIMSSSIPTEEEGDRGSVDGTRGSVQSWPVELTFVIGGPFIIFLGAAIACLIILDQLIKEHNGLPLPSNDTIIQQIVLTLLPTALGTILEPFWVALNRLICVLQPFYELHNGAASAPDSLLLHYASLPPQLSLWRALRTKHFLLAIMCTAAAVANVLTVSLSALFEMKEVDQPYPILLEQTRLPQLRSQDSTSVSGRLGEPFQVMLANLTGDAPLPPWISHDTYFLPVDLPSIDEPTAVEYKLKTVGIQSQLDWREMETSGSDLSYQFSLNADATQANFTMEENKPNGETIRCFSPNAYVADGAEIPAEDTQVFIRGSPAGKRGLEIFMKAKPSYASATDNEAAECPRMLVAGWMRSTITLENTRSKTIYGSTANVSSASVNQTWMMCKPLFQRGLFDLTVDGNGRVFDAVRAAHLNQTTDDLLGENVWNAVMFLIGQPPDILSWHEDTLAGDWANLLIRESGWGSIIDPKTPLPKFETLETAVKQVYQQLYAITLGVNKGELEESQEPLILPGKKIVKERRVFLSPTMFWITFAILVFDILVALVFYLRVPRPFLPRMPTSIASLLSYVAGSNIMLDLRKSSTTEEEAVSHFKNSMHRYGFGKYIGTDDQVNIGIDRQPYLLPQHGVSLKERIFSGKPIVRSTTVDSLMI